MSRKLRFSSLFLAVSMLVGMLAIASSAFAAPAAGTAAVDVKEVLAGRQTEFSFTVNNPSILGSDVNFVQIGPEFLGEGFTIVSGGAADWVFHVTNAGRARFTGGTIPAGESATFTVIGDPERPAEDLPVDWQVEVADDGSGSTVTNLTPAAIGALTTQIRVLQVTAINIVSPAGATDNTVTQQQPGVQVASTVVNEGSAPLTVAPTLSSSGETIGAPSPATASIPAGGSRTFTFPVTMGGPGARAFTGDATATGADAFSAQSPEFTVEDAATFAYTGNTLLPRASVSGLSQVFTLSLSKDKLPAVSLTNASRLTFTKGSDTFSTPLAGTTSVGRGPGSLSLTFAPIAIPGNPTTRDKDGSYTPSLQLVGTDDNGAPVSRTVSISDSFKIDNLMPVVLPTLAGPSGQSNPQGESVIKDGDTLTLGGEIKEGPGATDPRDATAVITSCNLIVNQVTETGGIGALVKTIPVPGCQNVGGQITGSIAPDDLGVNDGIVRLEVAARDAANNTSQPAASNFVAIDNLEPVFEAITGCGGAPAQLPIPNQTCDNTRTIRVNLSEPVKGDFKAPEFAVDGNAVLLASSTCTAETWCDQVVLTLATPIAEDDTPGVGYEFFAPTEPVRPRAVDGPAHELGDGLVDAVDGIVPDLPNVATVSQNGMAADGTTVQNHYGPQDGSFYTNDASPTFHITGLGQDYRALVALDTNGSGDYEEGVDTIIANCLSEAAEVDCEALGLGSDGDYDILVTSIDNTGNLSQGRTGTLAGKRGRPLSLTLDRVSPAGTDFTAAATSVGVSFDEPLARGRNAAVDWFPFVMEGTRKRIVKDTSVSGTGAARSITLDSTENGVGLSGVSYIFDATPDLRYQDRAGNYLADFTL